MNIEKIRSALQKINDPSSVRADDQNLVKLPKGDHIVRFTPYKFDKDMPIREYYFHYGISNKSFYCVQKMFGETCPVCQFGWELYNKFKSSGNKDLQEYSREFMPKFRAYAPIIVKESASEDVVCTDRIKFWGVAQQTYEEILGEFVSADAEGIDVTHPKEGLDFQVKMDNFRGMSNRFMVKSIKAARKQSKIIDGTDEEINQLLDSCVNIGEIFNEKYTKTIAEIEEALDSHINAHTKKDEDGVGTTKDFSSKSEKSESSVDDLDSKIDALFNNEK